MFLTQITVSKWPNKLCDQYIYIYIWSVNIVIVFLLFWHCNKFKFQSRMINTDKKKNM